MLPDLQICSRAGRIRTRYEPILFDKLAEWRLCFAYCLWFCAFMVGVQVPDLVCWLASTGRSRLLQVLVAHGADFEVEHETIGLQTKSLDWTHITKQSITVRKYAQGSVAPVPRSDDQPNLAVMLPVDECAQSMQSCTVTRYPPAEAHVPTRGRRQRRSRGLLSSAAATRCSR